MTNLNVTVTIAEIKSGKYSFERVLEDSPVDKFTREELQEIANSVLILTDEMRQECVLQCNKLMGFTEGSELAYSLDQVYFTEFGETDCTMTDAQFAYTQTPEYKEQIQQMVKEFVA